MRLDKLFHDILCSFDYPNHDIRKEAEPMTKIEMIITVRFGDGIGVVSGVTMPNYVHIGSARLRLG
jgi:hypothetical protein